MGIVLQEQGNLEEAIKAYNKALFINPDYAGAYYNMGIVLQDQGKMEEAIEAYSKALSIKPDYAYAYNNMGIALKEQGKMEEAIKAYNKALFIKPDYAEAYNNMGNALKDQGKLEEAIEAYNKSLFINPDNAEAVETSQNLEVQLLSVIKNFGYDFDKNKVQVKSETMLRPKYQIQNAIKAYLEADFSHAGLHIKNFKVCDQKILGKLAPINKVFCYAYSNFIVKLLEANWDNLPTSATENKVYHLGESHCLSYAHRSIAIDGSNFRIIPRITFGAKAFHFSRTGHSSFKSITKANFVTLPKRSKIFLSFGEIDCRPYGGFISASRKLEKPIEQLINETVMGYVQWFLEQNVGLNHYIYFINVPAPFYYKEHSTDLNSEVARTVTLFNAALKKYTLQHGFDMVDVFRFTAGKEGFSNGLFHVDKIHLGAKALLEIEQQLF
jgi:tetratricopeptide (TPR) repeat protein